MHGAPRFVVTAANASPRLFEKIASRLDLVRRFALSLSSAPPRSASPTSRRP